MTDSKSTGLLNRVYALIESQELGPEDLTRDQQSPDWIGNGHWIARVPGHRIDAMRTANFQKLLTTYDILTAIPLVEQPELHIPRKVRLRTCRGCQCGACVGGNSYREVDEWGQRVFVAQDGRQATVNPDYAALFAGLRVVALATHVGEEGKTYFTVTAGLNEAGEVVAIIAAIDGTARIPEPASESQVAPQNEASVSP